MLTREENTLLTRVDPGTPMGEMLREYWTPAVRSARLEADGAPVRVRLLGEDFVAFRSTDGRVGFFDEGEWKAAWYIAYDPAQPFSAEDREAMAAGTSGDLDNFASDLGSWDTMWSQNRKLMKEGHWSGIAKAIACEDFAVEESMGRIVDRSREYLGSSDAPIIRYRRMMLKSVRDFQKGQRPFGADADIDYRRIRALAIRYPKEQDWRTFDPHNPPQTVTTL